MRRLVAWQGSRLAALPLVALAVAGSVCAQAPSTPGPDTQQIIEALTPRTRSARNLIARDKAPDAAASAPDAVPRDEPPPSISLSIAFAFDSSRLEPAGQSALDRLAAALASPQLAAGRFVVQGHTDARGTPAYNRRLSQARADEARRYLVARGVDRQRLESVGLGSDELANPSDPYAAENRRVRIVNVGASESISSRLLGDIHRQRDPARVLEARARSDRLRIGRDGLALVVSSQREGYLYVALAGSDGRSVHLLFPNALDAQNRIAAGQTLELPRAGWEMVAAGPAGRGAVLVLVSDRPRDLSGLSAARAGPFMKDLLDERGAGRLHDVLTDNTPRTYGSALLTIEEVP